MTLFAYISNHAGDTSSPRPLLTRLSNERVVRVVLCRISFVPPIDRPYCYLQLT